MTKRKRKILIAAAVIFLCLTALSAYVTKNVNKMIIAMAEARAAQLAIEAINSAVDEVIGDGLRYGDLIDVKYDLNGQVSMLKANTPLMNELASKAALTAQRNLRALEDRGVSIPIAAAAGISLAGSSGPYVRVGVIPVGSVTTNFSTAFESAGINQTRHEISLEASTHMRIVVPLGAAPVTVTASVPVAQSIIVGSVPASYVNVADNDDMLNLIP